MIQTVRDYYELNVAAGRTGNNWLRVLIAFGAETHDSLTPFTAAEAWERVPRWGGWRPVAEALEQLEAQSAPARPTSSPTPTAMPTSTPLPTNTPAPTSTALPTNTPLPTSTLMPTSTPLPTNTPVPTSTPTPLPTNTPVPTSTPLPTSTPTATPTIQSVRFEPAQAAPLQAAPLQAEPAQAELIPSRSVSNVPTWVDGTNCFWWTGNQNWEAREFDTFRDWLDNQNPSVDWATVSGAEIRYTTFKAKTWHKIDLTDTRPAVVEFRKKGATKAEVSLQIALGSSFRISHYMNAFGLKPRDIPGNPPSYRNDPQACTNASLYFTAVGNIKPQFIGQVPRTYPPTATPTATP